MKVVKMIALIVISAYFITGCKDCNNCDVKEKGHPKINAETNIKIEPGSIKKADGGYTIEECYTKKSSLSGKKIKVRGKVTKFNENIMGKNWIHIQDGTGEAGKNDLTVTTKDKIEVGKIVLIQGKITYDKNFGMNYKYAAIVEEATVKAE